MMRSVPAPRRRSRRPRATSALAAVVLVVALVGPLAPSAGAQDVVGQRVRTVPVWPGVDREDWALTSAGGDPVRAQVARIAPGAPVELEIAFAQDTLPGLATVPSMARARVDDGAVLGINGGFWRSSPWGRPDGFTVVDGRLVSEAETRGEPGVGRGAFGLAGDALLVDRIRPQDVALGGPAQPSASATGINRLDREASVRVPADGDDALYVITDQFASTVTLPNDPDGGRGTARWRAVEGLTTTPRGQGQDGTVGPTQTAAAGATLAIPSSGALLVGYGGGASQVEGLAGGEALAATTTLEIDNPTPGREADRWADAELGLTGGPHIVRSGRMIGGWEGEGFGPAHHAPNPRTAVGVTDGGTILLVTVDGRQPGRTVGLGTAELASFFQQLGAEEAVMLDGGGSTTMTHDTRVVNEPSDGSPRPVANAVFVRHRETFDATERLAGAGREHTAAAVARAAFPQGAADAVLAAGTDFPDALAGGPLAAALDAPLLLANPDGVSAVTRSALADLGTDRVTVLGGEAAVPAAAVDQLRAAGYQVDRVAGGTRFSTAAEIAARLDDGELDRVVLASGLGFADALVAAPPAGMLGAPILLAAGDTLTGATREALARLAPDEVVVVGGTSAVSDAAAAQAAQAAGDARVTRLSGATRFATARAINDWAAGELGAQLDDSGLIIARGDRFPDALSGGPLGAARSQLLMIVPAHDVRRDGNVSAYLDRRAGSIDEMTLLGGFAVLSSYQQWQLEEIAGDSGGLLPLPLPLLSDD